MKIIDLLRKLGIVRYGSVGGTYKSYKDMPDELMYDNVYDKKKDLVQMIGRRKASGGARGGRTPSTIARIVLWCCFLFALLFLLVFFIGGGFSLWFVLSLVLWIVFWIFFRRYLHSGAHSFLFMFGLFVVFFVLTFIFLGIATPASPATHSPVAGVDQQASLTKCHFDGSTQPAKLTDFATDIYVSKIDAGKSELENGRTDTRTFSLKSYANHAATLDRDLFYKISRSDGRSTVTGIVGDIEVCDENNMTQPRGENTPGGPTSIGLIYYLHGGSAPLQPGVYRVDGILKDANGWHLTDRIGKVTFTE